VSTTAARRSEPLEKSTSRNSWFQILVRHPADRAWSCIIILLVLCGSLFFYGLRTGELYRTESLRAIIAAQFLRSGDWIVPTLYGEPLFTKPPGMYAAIALLSWPFGGVSEWTARLPSALAATAAVFLWFWYFSRHLGRRGGLLAAVILPLSLMWLDKATAAEIDMMQVAWVTAALLCFLRALEIAEAPVSTSEATLLSARVATNGTVVSIQRLEPPHPNPSPPSTGARGPWTWWLAALLCVAGGVLTKWTAPAFFYGTVVPLLWWRGRLRLLFGRHHIVSALVGAGVCFAWIGAAIALAGWHPFVDTVSREALMRLLPSHHYRPYPWKETLAHPGKILAANLPWALAILYTLRPSFMRLWNEPARRLLQALHCWVWPNLIFWTVIPEHAPRHSFPLFPGIAGLAAFVWIAWLGGRLEWPLARWRWTAWAQPAALLVSVVGLWLVVKVVYVHAVVPIRNHDREAQAKGRLIANLVPQGDTLYLFRLKDEGIMFYYGGVVVRLRTSEQLPLSNEPLYCILDESEWQHWSRMNQTEVLQFLRDEQGAPIVLLKVVSRPPGQGP
jgi:4-amino-4-deoxy-L-arabinose transferase-like glycosyltransferase